MSEEPTPQGWPEGSSIRRQEPLSRHTAWRCGGAAGAFVVVHRREALGPTLKAVRALSGGWQVLGAGTRTVVRSGGIAGTVLRLGRGFSGIRQTEGGWRVGAATPVPALVHAAARAGLSGVEELAAQPGSLGAAVCLDAGDWRDAIDGLWVWYRRRARRVEPDWVYERVAAGKRVLVLDAELQLCPDDPAEVGARSERVLARSVSSPWFQSPDGGPLRPLLTSASIPGARLRAVAVPRSAPEMLVALRPGCGDDLELLGRSVADKVERTAGVSLGTSVRFSGRHGG